MDKTFERSLLNALIILDKEGCKLARTGICGNVFHMLASDSDITMVIDKISDMAHTWPHHSGDACYPVEGNSLQFHRHVNKWVNEYGRLRKDLLKHLIKTLEKELEN